MTQEQDQPWFSLIHKVQKLTGTKMRYALLNRKQAYRSGQIVFSVPLKRHYEAEIFPNFVAT